MKKVVWIFYGALIIFFALLGLGVAISTGNSLVFTLINSAFTVLYLSGLYGYVYRKAIWKPSGWRFLFWLNAVSTGLRSLLMLFSPATEVVIDVVFGAVFSLPMLYALYQYSSANFTVWDEAHSGKQKALLSSLLESASELMASVVSSTPDGEEKTTVTVKSDGGEFFVRILKELNGETKSFSNSFSDLEGVAEFLESNTRVRVCDFV